MADEAVKLTYVAAQFRVKAEFTRALCIKSKAPTDIVTRAKAKMQNVLNAKEIFAFSVYEKDFVQAWELCAKSQLPPTQKIIFTLAEGAPSLQGLQIEAPANDKVLAEISIRADLKDVRNWRPEWIAYLINQKLHSIGSDKIVNFAQVYGALLRAQAGKEVTNFTLGAMPPPPSEEEKKQKPYSIIANKSRQEVTMTIRDVSHVIDKIGIEKMLSLSEDAVTKVAQQVECQFFFLRKEIMQSLGTLATGPELIGMYLPVQIIAASGVKPLPAHTVAPPAAKQVFNTAYAGAGKLNITVSSDSFQAYIEHFDMSLFDDKSFKMDREWVSNECRRMGLKEEFFLPYLDDIVDTLNIKETIAGKTIAQGKMSKGGTNPFLHLSYQDSPLATKPSADGKVDIRNMQQREIVHIGQIVAEVRYKVPPIIGRDVFGNDLEPAANEEFNVTTGDGIEQRKNGKFYATIDGIPKVDKTSISLSTAMEHQGDVNLRTGNIVFNGPVVIHGSIDNGAVVEVTGDLTVHGNIRGAFVKVGGNLNCIGGVIGGRGLVSVKGNAYAEFIENSKVQCGGSLTVKRIIINSDVIAGGAIEVKEEKDGIIAGGTVSCRQNLITGVLGFRNGANTTVNVGVDWKAELAVRIRQQRLEKVENKQKEDRQALREVMARKPNQMTPKHHQRKEYYQNRLVKFRTLLEKMQQHLDKAKALLVYDQSAIIFVRQTVFANVNVNVGGNMVPIKSDMAGVGILGKRKHGSFVVSIESAMEMLEAG